MQNPICDCMCCHSESCLHAPPAHAINRVSQGLDFQRVEIVIQYGMCQDLCSQIQRAGRCTRDPNIHGLFLYMPEPWALTQRCDLASQLYQDNPDLPLPPETDDSTSTSKAKSTPKDQRISQGSLAYVQSSHCRRQFHATYLGDESPNGSASRTYLTFQNVY